MLTGIPCLLLEFPGPTLSFTPLHPLACQVRRLEEALASQQGRRGAAPTSTSADRARYEPQSVEHKLPPPPPLLPIQVSAFCHGLYNESVAVPGGSTVVR